MLGLGLLVAGVVPMTVVGPNLPLVASRSAARQSPPTYVWPKIAHDSANTGLSADPGISNANAGTLGVRWMASTGASSVSSPVVAWNATLQKTLVYQGNDSGYLTAFDASDGATVWSVNLGSTILSSPLVEGNFVWIARAYGAVMYKLDAATGAVTCSTTLGSESDGSPTIGTPAGGSSTIYIAMHDLGTASGPLYGINEANCAVDFQFTGFNSVAGSWDPLSYATDVDGRALVLMGTSDPDQSVYAIDALTGTKVWSFVTPPLAGNTDTDVGAGIDVSPPGVNGFADGVAYVPAEDGYFFALDLTTGAVLWKYDFGTGLPQIHLSRSTPALAGNRLVFGEIGGVMCLDATTGALDWSFATGDVESISDPAIVGPASGQVVAVTTLAGAVDVLDLASGNLLYSFQTPTYSTSSIADVDGNLLASSADGYLYDFALGGGNGAGPSTAVTSPTAGSTIANPTGSELIRGTATAASGEDVEQVDVAIQSGGPSGQWWDGVTGTWTAGFFDNAATVVSPGTPSTDWSYSVPVPLAGGHFSVFASSAQGNGLADVTDLSATPGSSLVSFSIRNANGTPHVYSTAGMWVAPGGSVSVAATGFSAGETVDFDFAGKKISSAKANSSGSVAATGVTLPKTAAFGPAVIVATGTTSGRTGSVAIYVVNSWSGSGNGPLHLDSEPNDQIFIDHIAPGPPEFLSPAWSYPDGAAIDGSAAVARDIAYFGDSAGVVTALDIRNSQPLWSVTVSGAVASSPALIGSSLVFGTSADAVVDLAQSNGTQVWSTATSSPVESSPAVAGTRVYVGSDDGTLYALDSAKGRVIWTTKVAGAINGSPAVDTSAGLVVVGDSSGQVTALNISTGAVHWRFTTGGAVTGSATIAGGDVLLGSADGNAYALKESTGALLWSTATPAAITAGGSYYDSTVKAGTLYVVGSSDGTLTYLSPTTGAIVAATKVGGAVVGVAGANGWVTATTSAGSIYGLKRTGELEWVTSTGGFASAPVIVDGVVLTCGTDEMVRAFTVPGTPIP